MIVIRPMQLEENRYMANAPKNSDDCHPKNDHLCGRKKGTAQPGYGVRRLVDLLDGRTVIVASSATRGTAGEATSTSGHTTGHATLATSTVELHHDGVGNSLKLLLLRLVLILSGLLAVVEPLDGLVDLGLELLLVASLELLIDLGVGEGVAERVGVGLKSVLGGDAGSLSFVFLLVFLGLSKHTFDLVLGKTTLVVGDNDLVGLSGALLKSGDVHDTVGVHVEGDLDLRNTTGSRRDASKLELAEQVVVLGTGTLALVDLNKHTGLVVGEGGEDLGLLGGDSGVALDERGHDTTSGLDTDGERGDVQEKDLVGGLGRSVTRQDSSLDSGTVGDSLVGVDRLVGLLAVEEVGDELLNLGDTGGTTNKDDLVDGRLVALGVTENTLDGLHGGAEEILAQLFETSTGDGCVEVNTLEQGVDFDRSLGGGRKSALGTLAGGAETAESTSVGGEILLVLRFVSICPEVTWCLN